MDMSEYKFTEADLSIIIEALDAYERSERKYLEEKQNELLKILHVQADSTSTPEFECFPEEDENEDGAGGKEPDFFQEYQDKLRALIEHQQKYLVDIGHASSKAFLQRAYFEYT